MIRLDFCTDKVPLFPFFFHSPLVYLPSLSTSFYRQPVSPVLSNSLSLSLSLLSIPTSVFLPHAFPVSHCN